MLTNLIKNIYIFLLITSVSCIEPFFTDETIFEEVLVVEGMITNDVGPYKIILSKTTSAVDPIDNPVTDAIVKISDDSGSEETLIQSEPGVYLTDTFGITGTVGRKYKINIETSDGKKYESKYSELKEPVPINKFFCTYESDHNYLNNIDYKGYRFYVEFQPYTEKKTYLLWRSTETYEYESPFNIDYEWVGYLKPFEKPDTFETCWMTADIKEINTITNDPGINKNALTVELNHSLIDKFAIKYSLLLKQLSVDEETIKYWNEIYDLNEGQNSFYNFQPYQIKGNIRNVSDADETVLGFFFAAGISKKRIFQFHPGLPRSAECIPDFRGYGFIRYWPPSMWPIYVVNYRHSGAFAIGDEECFDCRLLGGSIIEPDFWE